MAVAYAPVITCEVLLCKEAVIADSPLHTAAQVREKARGLGWWFGTVQGLESLRQKVRVDLCAVHSHDLGHDHPADTIFAPEKLEHLDIDKLRKRSNHRGPTRYGAPR